jgi:hypothetical protein
MAMEETHRKVAYLQGDLVRVLVGDVRKSADGEYIDLVRPGGTISLNKRFVIWIGPATWSDRDGGGP